LILRSRFVTLVCLLSGYVVVRLHSVLVRCCVVVPRSVCFTLLLFRLFPVTFVVVVLLRLLLLLCLVICCCTTRVVDYVAVRCVIDSFTLRSPLNTVVRCSFVPRCRLFPFVITFTTFVTFPVVAVRCCCSFCYGFTLFGCCSVCWLLYVVCSLLLFLTLLFYGSLFHVPVGRCRCGCVPLRSVVTVVDVVLVTLFGCCVLRCCF
jgi:hypothetical protein